MPSRPRNTNSQHVEAKLEELIRSECPKAVRMKIQDLLQHGSDFDVYKINAFRIADELKIPRSDALRGFLYATRLGLFDLQWDIYCPSCRGLPEYYRHMMGLKRRGHCPLCEIDWELDFEKQVEVTFTVNPALRRIRFKDFHERDFRGMMEFINATQTREGRELAVGECIFPDREVEVSSTLSPGRYVYWATEKMVPPGLLEVSRKKAVGPQSVQLLVERTGRIRPDRLALNAGPVTFRIASRLPRMQGFLVDLDRPVNHWVSAHFVAMQQDFKDLFDSEFLSPETSFAVQNVTLMFTDLKDSTRMYEKVGDARAFSLVKTHFEVMTRSIQKFEGGIVKTIGDAVMAAFPSNLQALEAAMEIQKSFASKKMKDEGLQVKIGIHRGPVIAVNSNNRLDYFGRTVNMAARVQGMSSAGEVLLSSEVFSETGISALIQRKKWKTRHFTAALKGIEPDPTLYSVARP